MGRVRVLIGPNVHLLFAATKSFWSLTAPAPRFPPSDIFFLSSTKKGILPKKQKYPSPGPQKTRKRDDGKKTTLTERRHFRPPVSNLMLCTLYTTYHLELMALGHSVTSCCILRHLGQEKQEEGRCGKGPIGSEHGDARKMDDTASLLFVAVQRQLSHFLCLSSIVAGNMISLISASLCSHRLRRRHPRKR